MKWLENLVSNQNKCKVCVCWFFFAVSIVVTQKIESQFGSSLYCFKVCLFFHCYVCCCRSRCCCYTIKPSICRISISVLFRNDLSVMQNARILIVFSSFFPHINNNVWIKLKRKTNHCLVFIFIVQGTFWNCFRCKQYFNR